VPLAYLDHRTHVFWTFLTGDNLVGWFVDVEHPGRTLRADDPVFSAFAAMHDALKPTPLFRMGVWFVVCLGVTVLAWRRRTHAHAAFACALTVSAIVYLGTYCLVGVAADYRYGYFAVLAGLAGAATLAAGATKADRQEL